jgi:hypothetical protein
MPKATCPRRPSRSWSPITPRTTSILRPSPAA